MDVRPPKTVDEYLDRIPSADAFISLSALRAIIRGEAPDAEELISYGMPTYKCRGFLASFGAFKKHCSFFPGHTVADFTEELRPYRVAKGTVQFPHDKPLPEPLVRAMIRARLAENLSNG